MSQHAPASAPNSLGELGFNILVKMSYQSNGVDVCNGSANRRPPGLFLSLTQRLSLPTEIGSGQAYLQTIGNILRPNTIINVFLEKINCQCNGPTSVLELLLLSSFTYWFNDRNVLLSNCTLLYVPNK